jgi:hypothetical protein
MITDIYYTYASKKELLDIGADPATIFENISELSELDNSSTGLNQAELTNEQCIALIPVGEYCYTRVADEHSKYDGFLRTKTCPFWDKIIDFPKQNNGYCHYRKQGDWQMGSVGLLWDQCKCCGINETREEDLILE